MSAEESSMLIEAFDRLLSASSFKQKSEILAQAKHFIFNKMKADEIRDFFVNNPSNFQNLFNLDIWTKDLEHSGGIVDYLEAYEIIEKIFHTFNSLNDVLNSFYDQVVFLLSQQVDEKVKHVCLSCLINFARQLDYSNAQTDFLSREQMESKLKGLLVFFVNQIPNTTANYANLLTDLICFLTVRLDKIEAKHQENLNRVHVFSCSILENNLDFWKALETISNKSSVLSFRIMEMFIHLACISNNHLVNIAEQKYKLSEHINDSLNNNVDILSQLNCIELIGDLVLPAHGYYYMQKSGHLERLLNYLDMPTFDLNATLLVPAIVKLFGHIAKERPQDCQTHYPKYFQYLFKTGQDENVVKNAENITFAIETFCYIFENNIVKAFIVENYRNDFLSLLQRLVWLTKNCINDRIKTHALRCLCELFAPDCSLLDCNDADVKWKISPWISSDWTSLSRNIYEQVTHIMSHENFFNMCLSFAKEPFAENRKSAHLYFKALSQSEWGLRLLFTPNKFNCEEKLLDGYLLNRSIELDKESLESKLEMIKLMVVNLESNPILINVIGEVAYEKLKHYVNEGAFWIRGESQVAFESV